MFLKRLLFLKASLDNEANNQPLPFNEVKTFKTESKPSEAHANTELQSYIDTKGATDKDDLHLMITQPPEDGPALLQLMPPSGYERFGHVPHRHPQTAAARIRTRVASERNKASKINSLNMTATSAQDQPVLLGRIEQNKFKTDHDKEAMQEL